MNPPPVIFLALARWDSPYSSTAFALAREMANNRKVFYLENPFTLKDLVLGFLKPQLRKRIAVWLGLKSFYHSIPDSSELIIVYPPLVLPINWLPKGKIYRFLSQINNKRLLKRLQRIIKDHQLSEFHLINIFQPFYGFDLPKEIQPKRYLYFCVDVIRHSAYIGKHGHYLEKEIMQQVDAVCTTSSQLQAYAESSTSRPVYLIPNGVNFTLFSQPANPPQILAREKRKIILYTGAIGLRIDYVLLEKIAFSFLFQLLVLVGPKTQTFEETGLNQYENVLFTGPRPLEELPGFLAAASCTIIPFRCNELTRGIYPLKINEYLAAGKPVVTTRFSPDLQQFENVIEIADSHETFIQKLAQTMEGEEKELSEIRRNIAGNNRWEQRLQLLDRVLEQDSDNLRNTIKP